jgi:aminopeptidase N
MGANVFRFNNFIDEVTAHEVSHQWWGHLVGWSSYHDQWLSEGFAYFSAGLFLQATEKSPQKYLDYWKRARVEVLEKNNFGNSANDAGPIWMGERLDTFKTAGSYNALVYRKGGYALHMLRYLMQDPNNGDADFVAMMHDFTTTYANKNASTEDFEAIVNKHMKPQMDLGGNLRAVCVRFRGRQLPSKLQAK